MGGSEKEKEGWEKGKRRGREEEREKEGRKKGRKQWTKSGEGRREVRGHIVHVHCSCNLMTDLCGYTERSTQHTLHYLHMYTTPNEAYSIMILT